MSLNKSIVQLLVFSISVCTIVACSSSKNKGFLYSEYANGIKEHRYKTEQGLTVGERAPLKKEALKYIRYYDIDREYRVLANVVMAKDEEPFEIPTYSGITKTFLKYATLTFRVQGVEEHLSVYRNLEVISMPMYRDYLFLPYNDETNDEETYGGGRYINMTTKDMEEGRVLLDFNKSYNPWCAYSEGYNCPIPPAENQLSVKVKAGEMMYAGK